MNNMEEEKNDLKGYLYPASIVFAGVLIAGAIFSSGGNINLAKDKEEAKAGGSDLQAVLPPDGVTLPVLWGDLGAKLALLGAIDMSQLKAVHGGAIPAELQELLLAKPNQKLLITEHNARHLLNVFWALGLVNKNAILETGEIADPRYGGTANFASTGGWMIARGSPMDHFGRHDLLPLTDAEQSLVDRVSQGIYRPCCNNATHFPDCNHGMAMLGFLELMASQGRSEEEMWRAALVLNSYWFPETYLTIAAYMKEKGVEWSDVDSKVVLGKEYSSGSGFQRIAAQVTTPIEKPSVSCGVEPAAKQSGPSCGI